MRLIASIKSSLSQKASVREGLHRSLMRSISAVTNLVFTQLMIFGRVTILLLSGRFHVAHLYASFVRDHHEDSLKSALGLPVAREASPGLSELFHELVTKGALGLEHRPTFGQIEESRKLFAQARDLQRKASLSRGLSPLSPRLMGSDFFLTVGHFADGFISRLVLNPAELEPYSYWLLRSRGFNRAYVELFRPHLSLLELDPLLTRMLEEEMWFLKDVSTFVELADGRILHTHEARHQAQIVLNSDSHSGFLQCPPAYMEAGLEELEKRGLDPNSWFISIHVREGGLSRGANYSRNASISTYEKAIDTVIECGGQVIRVGDTFSPKLRDRKGLLDYAHVIDQVPEANVFFMARPRFLIATSSGALTMAASFGTPIVITNATHILLQPSYPNTIMLPKLYVSAEKSIVPFSEVFSDRLPRSATHIGIIKEPNHKLRENSIDEIVSATLTALESTFREERLAGVEWDLSLYPEAKSIPPPVDINFAEKWKDAFS